MLGALQRFLRRVGEFQSALLLTVVYFLLWLPVGYLSRFFADWLNRRPGQKTLWFPKAGRVNDPRTLRDPY